MDKIVTSSFSVRDVHGDLTSLIDEFKYNFLSTGVSETLKIHIIMSHIPQCLQFLNGKGLGIWSEQAGEAIHREFLKFWSRYKINLKTDPNYSIRLMKAVVEFSSRHI
jgi:hypothetical protein